MKAITKVTTLLLSSLLALLGFGGCRSAKKAQREMEAEQHRMDSIARADLERQEQEEALRQRQKEIERQRARENEIRVLYGPPPSRFIKNIDK